MEYFLQKHEKPETETCESMESLISEETFFYGINLQFLSLTLEKYRSKYVN